MAAQRLPIGRELWGTSIAGGRGSRRQGLNRPEAIGRQPKRSGACPGSIWAPSFEWFAPLTKLVCAPDHRHLKTNSASLLAIGASAFDLPPEFGPFVG